LSSIASSAHLVGFLGHLPHYAEGHEPPMDALARTIVERWIAVAQHPRRRWPSPGLPKRLFDFFAGIAGELRERKGGDDQGGAAASQLHRPLAERYPEAYADGLSTMSVRFGSLRPIECSTQP
jgi:hypothetical protein